MLRVPQQGRKQGAVPIHKVFTRQTHTNSVTVSLNINPSIKYDSAKRSSAPPRTTSLRIKLRGLNPPGIDLGWIQALAQYQYFQPQSIHYFKLHIGFQQQHPLQYSYSGRIQPCTPSTTPLWSPSCILARNEGGTRTRDGSAPLSTMM